jgi:uracil-DNA glycosylase
MKQNELLAVATNTLDAPLQSHLEQLHPAWRAALDDPRTCAALQSLSGFLADRLADGAEIYPRRPLRALDYVQPDTARVIVLGQDPYHGPNQAQGLAFSVPDECPCPPSLRNMLKELALEFPGHGPRKGHELSGWARQGVLLLNAVLTVESRSPASHTRKGWEVITDALIREVARSPQPKVFMLWGAYAQSKRALIEDNQEGPTLVLAANHPSPLSAQRPPVPFIGCGHFATANAWLQSHGQPPVDWLGGDK